jgi:hypothetical protein
VEPKCTNKTPASGEPGEIIMRILVEVEEAGEVVRSAECEVSEAESVRAVARRLASQLAVEVEELEADLGVAGITFEPEAPVRECIAGGTHWRHRRVCVELHFESETVIHHFPPRWHWAKVHHFGCRHFHVSHDACANLELREGTPAGPALNEKVEVGVFPGCKSVWLVKPGPEPNGRST